MTSSDRISTPRFPVDLAIPQIVNALAGHSAVILQAPPGAGKTTRVPPALLEISSLAGKSILMLEPRRIAAVTAASYMAQEMGEEVGKTVGYTIRYERRVSRSTRIEVVTEGVLTRRLQSDPELNGVGLVIFDEFHERNLHSDLALALCRDAQMGLRPDLKLVIMSATLETEVLSRLLDNAPVVSSAGTLYPVEVSYADSTPAPRSIASEVTASVERALRETEGDILVFLPGAKEIRQIVDRLQQKEQDADIYPLHGGLSLTEQRRAIEPGERRKVVVATNVAETSLTIQGVRNVIDSGLEKRPRFDAARGLTRLETVKISRASADQRAGRAGRLGPGRCYRLWDQGDHGSLLSHAPPEIFQADLTPLAIDLARWGVAEAKSLVWVDLPPSGHLIAARQLLSQLGALDAEQKLTATGEQMAEIPAHPRLSRLLLQAIHVGCPELGADLVAILGEGQSGGRVSDVMEALHHLAAGTASARVSRASKYWRRRLNCLDVQTSPVDSQIACLLAFAYPDRIAMLREGSDLQYLLANGMAAEVDAQSILRGAEFLVVIDLQGYSRAKVRISLAVRIERDDFERLFGHHSFWQRQVAWDSERKLVVAHEIRLHGALQLQTRPVKADAAETTLAILNWIRTGGLDLLHWDRITVQLLARLRFVTRFANGMGWPDYSDNGLMSTLETWLGPYLTNIRTADQLRRVDLYQPLLARLDWSQKRALDRLAPEKIKAPSGSNVTIDYSGEQPVLAVKLQELFGLVESPRVAGGQVPLLIQLLSPAGRPLQSTTDLKSFWANGYPEVKKEMKGRYPKHPWPDDPWSATPTKRTKQKI